MFCRMKPTSDRTKRVIIYVLTTIIAILTGGTLTSAIREAASVVGERQVIGDMPE